MQPIIQKPAIATVITPQEKTILGSTGIVLGEMQNTVGETSTVSSRSDILQGIENPTKTPSATIVANKLSTSATLMPNKTTDYSLPRTTPQSSTPITPAPSTPVQQSGDQYREKI